MTKPHEGSFNGHVKPNAIGRTSVVVHRVLSVDEMRTYAIGQAFHSSHIVECIPGIVDMPCGKEQRDQILLFNVLMFLCCLFAEHEI